MPLCPMLLHVKGHLWDSQDIFLEILRDTSRQIFTLSLINNIVCKSGNFADVICICRLVSRSPVAPPRPLNGTFLGMFWAFAI